MKQFETRNIAMMDRWCARFNAIFGSANDVVMARGCTTVRWNKRVKLIYRFGEQHDQV